MSDYSKLKIEQVADLPAQYSGGGRLSKPLAPVSIFKTLPILKDLEINDTVKITIPEDSFTYTVNTAVSKDSANYYASLKSALFRTFNMISEEEKIHFVYRVVGDDLYIKRVDN